jgi:hypothetical protein
MADPFRQPGTTPTAAALAKLDAMRVDPIRSLCALYVSYRVTDDAPALAVDTAAAEKLEMTYVGSAAEGLMPPMKKRIFVDLAGTTQAHISSIYFFATYFESGKCILTFKRPPQTQSNDNLLARAGVGDFATDYQSHCAAVAEWVDNGEVTIVVRDIEAAVRLGNHYYRHVLGVRNALSIVMTPAIMAIIIVLAILYLL